MLITSPPPLDEPSRTAAAISVRAPAVAGLSGRIFTDLDRLAFALEMEAARELEAGDDAGTDRTQALRPGMRRVAGVYAAVVNGRIERWVAGFEARLAGGAA